MVSFHIAFDNHDYLLGEYFEQSKNDIIEFIKLECQTYDITEIPTPRCNQAYIDMRMTEINGSNFLFLAYSHGNDDSLIANGAFFIKKDVNASLFVNSLFYSMCCLSGKELGADLINNGCHAFIGFNDEAEALAPPFRQLSIECDNHGIKNFIRGLSAGQSFDLMRENFTQQVDYLVSNGEILRAAYLAANRDALWFEGNRDIKFTDFMIN